MPVIFTFDCPGSMGPMTDHDPNDLNGSLKGIIAPNRPSLRGMDLAEVRKPKGLPPVHLWNPDFCGMIPMTIKRDGTWHYMGTPINRPAMVRLFSTILRREPDGSFVLVTPVERVGIEVEDAPFLAIALHVLDQDGRIALEFETSVGDRVIAGPEHEIRVETAPKTGEPSPYVHIRAGLEARLSRSVFYELVDLGFEREGLWGVESLGVFFALGPAE